MFIDKQLMIQEAMKMGLAEVKTSLLEQKKQKAMETGKAKPVKTGSALKPVAKLALMRSRYTTSIIIGRMRYFVCNDLPIRRF